MEIPGWRVEVRQKFLVDASFLILLAVIIVIITVAYISTERNFHWWIDWYERTLAIVNAFRESPLEAMQIVGRSLISERNRLFTVPLVPFMLIFGSSRLVYEIALALVYLLPFALVLGAIAAQLVRVHTQTVFWVTAFLTILLPVSWITTFIGIPDTGGAVLIGLATLIYLQDVRLKQWWRIPLIGFFLGASILLRRHFFYGGVAFLGALTVQALIFFALEARKQQPRGVLTYRFTGVSTYLAAIAPVLGTINAIAWKNLFFACIRIGLIGVATLVTIGIVAPQFTYAALTVDYKTLYTSWSLPLGDIFNLYASFYGWGTWMLVVLGFSASILTRTLPLSAVSFIGLTGVLSLFIWLVRLRYGNVFYSLHITPFVVIGLVALLWTNWSILRGKARAIVLGVVSAYLVGNLIIGLAPLGTMSRVFHPLFALNMAPLVRTDYDEAVRLVNYLRQLAANDEPIFVVGFQRLQLVSSMVRAVEQVLYPPEQRRLNVLVSPEVDSRDFYPLEGLLEAQYVVVPSALPQYSSDPTELPVVGEWLPNKEYDVANVVFDAFTQDWEFVQDFKRLPIQFQFENGVTVSIYQRIRPTSLETAVRTLHTMQQRIGEQPGSQGEWIVLSQWKHNTTLAASTNNTYDLVAFRRNRLFESVPLAKELGLYGQSRRASLSQEAEPELPVATLTDEPDSLLPFMLPKVSAVKAQRNHRLEQQRSTEQSPQMEVPQAQLVVESDAKSLSPKPSGDRTQQVGTSLLYLGSVSERAKVTGAMVYLDRACVGSSLRVAMLDRDGHILSSTESAYKHNPKKATPFELSVRGQNPDYILFNVLNYDRNDRVNSCTLQIRPLAVSTQK